MFALRPNIRQSVTFFRTRIASVLAASLLVVLILAASAHAQTGQGSITGRVTDARDAVVPHAAVVVTNNDTQVQSKTETNSSGIYNVLSLIPGSYTVQVTGRTFAKTVISNITVGEAQSVETNVTLTIGKVTETINVEAEDSLLSKTVSDVTTTVDHQLVEDLPYPERSSLEAVLLVPGVTGDITSPGGIDSERPSFTVGPVTPGAGITVGGAPPGGTSFMVDGSDVIQGSYARSGINLSGNLVQETTVIVSGMSAQYGRTGAGLIIQGSRSGSDTYHGGITWRHTDPFFDANTALGSNRQNYYGFYLGGAIRIPKVYNGTSKSFFFAGVEPARVTQKYRFRGIFPTPEALAGHLNGDVALNGGNIYYQNTPNAQGFPTGPLLNGTYPQITGPLADCGPAYAAANPAATTCPNDVAPELAQNPFAQFVLGLFPTPTNPGPYVTFDNATGASASDGYNANFIRGVISKDNRYSIRLDQQINGSNRAFVRYTVIPVNSFRISAVATDNPLTQTPAAKTNSYDLAAGLTHIFSNSVVGNFHYSYLRVNQPNLQPAVAQTQDYAAKYGLTPSVTGKGFPSLGAFGGPGIPISNYTLAPANGNFAINIDQNYITGADFTWTHGTNLFQFGGDVRWIQSDQYNLSGETGGTYQFSYAQTNNPSTNTGGSSLATFILGDITSFSNTPVAVPGYYRWRYYAGYFQDNWRATSRVTINAGLRYNIETPRMEKFNNQAFITPAGGISNGVTDAVAFCFSGACGNGKTLWPTNYKSFEPRFGIAVSVTPRSTLRAAYALSHTPLSGYENTPDPNFNLGSTSVGGEAGGVLGNNSVVNYITNPVNDTPPIASAYTSLMGSRGPFYSSTSIAPVFVSQIKSIPYIQTYSMTYQFEPFKKTLVQLTYQGTKGTHLIGPFNLGVNTAPIAALTAAIQQNVYLGYNTPNTVGVLQNGSPLNETALQRLAPYQNFYNQILPEIYPRRGVLEYNGLYTSVNQRYNQHLSFVASFTWTKSLDNVPDNNAGTVGGYGTAPPQNPFDLHSEYSVSTFDQPTRFKAGYTYDLPFGKGQQFYTSHAWVNNLIGGFKISGIATVASGFPNYVVLGTIGYFSSITPGNAAGLNHCTVNGTTVNYCGSTGLPAGYTIRPNFVPGQPLINKNWKKNPYNTLVGGISPYLNSAAFTTPGTPGNPQFGNVPRTLSNARTPREFLFDMNAAKAFTVHGRYRVSLTTAAINVFNHSIFPAVGNHNLYSGETINTGNGTFNPPTSLNPATFGNLATTSGLSRTLLFGAQFLF